MFHRLFSLLALLLFFTACQQDSLSDTELVTGEQITLEERESFPQLIPLPNGFQPEGIVAGTGNDFYVGSLADGSVYKGDFRSGAGEVWFTPDEPRMAVGLAFDPRSKYLFVSGGGFGSGYVVDTRTGEELMNYSFGGGFVNDVIVTKDAAYFTDSFAPNVYKVPLGSDGSLSAASDAETLALSGDYVFVPNNFNANGIEATPKGDALIVNNSATGTIYRVDPDTGEATAIDLSGASIPNTDGILLVGKTLYLVQNFLNQVAVVNLSADYLSGSITNTLTDSDFQIPTTITRHGSILYVVNARFDVAPPGTPADDIEFDVVRVGE